jgi:magnesium and cobalt transporter
MLQRTLRFSETTVGEVMVPRSDVDAIDLRRSTDEILDKIAGVTHSRFPAFRETVDEIEGIIFLHDVFRLARQGGVDLASIVKPALFVPETLRLDDMVERFRTSNTQMAIVIDEYGGTAGMVTFEDIIEAVFGRIQDQTEDQRQDIAGAGDGRIVLRGDARLAELNETFGWSLDADDVDTIGGYVMHRLGRIPRVGDAVDASGRRFRVTKMDVRRVDEILVLPAKTEPAP